MDTVFVKFGGYTGIEENFSDFLASREVQMYSFLEFNFRSI